MFLHLLRSKNEKPLLEVNYWRDYAGREVDFVVKEGHKVTQLIQVTYASDFAGVKANEVRNLIAAAKEMPCRNLAVVTWDYGGEKTVEGCTVKFIPLWKMLLAETATAA